METEIVMKLLQAHQKHGKLFHITVEGISMNPVLEQGDVITLKKHDCYHVGDVVVFKYKEEGILIHRLVKKRKSRYYCKGDNAFRIEEVVYEDIIGKAMDKVIDDKKVQIYSNGLFTRFICLYSRTINRKYIEVKSVQKTKESNIYMFYKWFYLR